MNNKGFIGMVGLILTIAIISCLAYFIFVKYSGKPSGMDKNTQEIANEAGIDTTSQISVLDSVKSTLKGAEEKEQSQ